MLKFGKWIASHRVLVVIIAILLLIPSTLGMIKTRVNYDVLTYLPAENETVKGQEILTEDFGIGAFSMVVVEGMNQRQAAELKSKLEKVEGVESVLWYDSLLDISVPVEAIPEKAKDILYSDNGATMMIALFSESTSSDVSMKAIRDIRKIAGESAFASGMTAVVEDTRELADKETFVYVGISVLLCVLALAVAMKSVVVPLIFMLSIGVAVLFNMGTNVFLGEISYITKAIAAVLQLAVTMDYSIFLYNSFIENKHRYPDEPERAMGHAISNTIKSVVGSSFTTMAGFFALCFMSFLLGKDLGVVMMKGVAFGVIVCVTVLPSLLLFINKYIDKAIKKADEKKSGKSGKSVFEKLSGFITEHTWVFMILFLMILVPAYYGQSHTKVYYKLDSSLPENLPSVIANNKLAEDFNVHSAYMILMDSKMNQTEIGKMVERIKDTDGVSQVVGLDSLVGPAVPVSMLPNGAVSKVKNEDYQIEIILSDYEVASDEMTCQVNEINAILDDYSEKSVLVGEAPLTLDLIKITDHDFKVVNFTSIIAVFLIIFIVFRSVSLPFILVAVIEFAIFINMGIPFYTNSTLPFVASIVIGTIQLGSTVDYAILMTSRYQKERHSGKDKKEALLVAHKASSVSIIMSASGFFAATFGVAVYSSIDMISSLCFLMARGSLISMVVVITILPAFLYLFDPLIAHTTMGFLSDEEKNKNKRNMKNNNGGNGRRMEHGYEA